jgi:drug/metabolite transporter (DMT)-like permease
MEQLASVLILLSGLTHAIVNAILKAGKDKLSGRALIDGFSALMVAPVAFFVPLPAGAWHWLGISWFAHTLYLIALIKSFEQADMSVAYPISRGLAPMLAATGAVVFFHEAINAVVVAGIAAVAAGVVLVGVSHTVRRGALLWAALTGLCVAFYTVIDAQGVRAAPSAASYIVWTFLMLGTCIGGVFAVWRGREFLSAAVHQWRPGVIAGAISVLSYGLALMALRVGATPRLAALRETSILFGAAIAVVLLKERFSRYRLAGIVVIAAGAIVLVAGG